MTKVEEMNHHVSCGVRDAWLAIPPCTGKEPYCHVDCPYFSECYPEDFEDYDDESWDED